MSQKYKKVNKSTNSAKIKNYYLLPIIIILTFIPLIARLHIYNSKLSKYSWFPNNDYSSDIFLYWKSIFFIICCVIIACIILYKLYYDNKNIKFTYIFIPLGVYAVFALLSSIVSKYSYFSFHGIYEQFEPVWVLLGYCIVAYYAYLYVNSEENIRKVFHWFLLGIIMICLIGISQTLSLDFYRTTIGKMFYLPISQWKNFKEVDFNFELGRVYASFYNPNYVGFYSCLIIPILLVLIMFSKKIKYTIGYIVILLGILVCLFGSQSRSGIIALFVSLILLSVLFRKYIFKKWNYFIFSCILLVASFFIVNHLTNNVLFTRIANMFNAEHSVPPLSEIQTNDNNVTVIYKGQPLKIQFLVTQNASSYNFNLTDKNGAIVNTTASEEPGKYIVNDSRYPAFILYPVLVDKQLCFSVQIDSTNWYFTNQTKDGTYYYYNNLNKLAKISNPKTAIFTNNQTLASRRGYIWARTIPLLKKYIIIGSGADTFSLVFPNDDYIGKFNHSYENQIITKPHCMYLQIGVQTGLLSLFAFLIFYGLYFFTSLKLYFNHKFDTYISQIGAGILVATLGYMITGLTNDSTITVAPIFWVFIGIGLGINQNLKKQLSNIIN